MRPESEIETMSFRRFPVPGALAALAALAFSGWAAPALAQLELHGFVEATSGLRLSDPEGPPDTWEGAHPDLVPRAFGGQEDYTLRESRVQLKGDLYGDVGEAHFVTDLLADQVAGGGAQLVLREGYVKFDAFGDHLEVRAGRQPTTWGTGDLLFINDLFPKDWVSFFVGREDQYLKRPSDVVRLGIFGLPATIDLVVTPEFTPDNIPTGERLVFWTPAFAPVIRPAPTTDNAELAVRMSRYVGNLNLALYAYRGFWKSPVGVRRVPTDQIQFYHPELRAYGASARGGLFGGVGWAEGAFYHSSEDCDGDDPLVPNSEIRAMGGYERQWWSDFTGGAQLYWEGVQDYVGAEYVKDENRLLATLRLTQLRRYQTVELSGFVFWSPTDEDAYVRLLVGYDYSDQLNLALGTNLFTGPDERTLFGMNEDNSNIYARVRFTY